MRTESVARATAVVASATVVRYSLRFIASVVLARLLSPEVFGSFALIALLYGTFSLFSALQTEGIVIQSGDQPKRILAVSFTLELLLSVVCCAAMVVTAPLLLTALGSPELAPYAQVLALGLLFNPFLLFGAFAVRELDFRKVSIASLVSIALGVATKVGLAATGFGIWSFILGALVAGLTEAGALLLMVPQKVRLQLDWDVLKRILCFTLPLTLAAILSYVWWNVDDLMVGGLLGSAQLGFYYLAFRIPDYMYKFGVGSCQALFPAFCRAENREHLRNRFMLASKYSALIFFLPCAVALAFGQEIIRLVYGEKWLPAARPFQVFMVVVAFRLTTWHWTNLLKSQGRTREPMYAGVIYTSFVGVVGYFALRSYGLVGIAFAILASEIIFFPLVVHWVRTVIDVDYRQILLGPLTALGVTTVVGLALAPQLAGSSIGAVCGILLQTLTYFLLCRALERPMLGKMQYDLLKVLRKA